MHTKNLGCHDKSTEASLEMLLMDEKYTETFQSKLSEKSDGSLQEFSSSNTKPGLKSTICQLCSKDLKHISTLGTHYIYNHYSEKIKARFGHCVSGKTCLLCDKTYKNPQQVWRDVGISHGKLNEMLVGDGYVPLPKTRPRSAKIARKVHIESHYCLPLL